VKPLINRKAKSVVIKKRISKRVEINASYWGIMDEDEEREVG
jgi:hypothetical protein